MLASLFKASNAIATQEIEQGEDPKTVLCILFKQGKCNKGDKCKFSHDMSLDGKTAQKSIYEDDRLKKGWIPTTDVICKHFMDSVEKELYGWRWVCPNAGDEC